MQQLLRTFFLAALALAAPWLHAAGSFPQRAVTIVVPYSAGGVTDYFARHLGHKLAQRWGQPVVVDNRAGGGTLIGTQLASKAAADGYTLLFTSYGFTANQVLRSRLPYDSKALRPVALLGSSHNVLLLNKRFAGQSLAQVLAAARAEPGGLKLASSGLASSPHIGAEFFARKAGIEFTHVPYKGQGPAMNDLTAGVVDGMFDGMSSYAQVRSGHVVALAIAAERRHPDAPEIPTFRELGLDLVTGTWFGLLAPAGTPDAVVERINADLREVLQDAELKAQIARTGLSVTASTPQAFGEFLAREADKLEQLVRQGVRIELQ